MNVLTDIMIVDVAQFLYLKVVLGVKDRNNDLSKQHAAPNVVDQQEEAHVVLDVNRVHLIFIIELEKLHRVAFQSDLLFCLLVDPLHVHVVVILILVVNFIDIGDNSIVIAIK